jgi:hypothetical protein
MPPGRNRAFHRIHHGEMVEVKRAIPYSRQRTRSWSMFSITRAAE